MPVALIAALVSAIPEILKLVPLVTDMINGLPEGQEKEQLAARWAGVHADVTAASTNWRNSTGPNG